MVRKTLAAVTALTAVLLTSCSETPSPTASKAEAKTEAPAEAVAGQNAFYQMYKPARAWAPDIMPLTLAGNDIEGIQSRDGKFPMWTAVFVSPSRREARTFFYSVINHGRDIHKGVAVGGAQTWSGATNQSKPFVNAEFNVNSDAAYKAASDKAGAWLKKNPDKKCTSMLLLSASRFSSPVWYVLWGDKKAGYDIFISATTGLPVAAGKSK